MQLILNYYMGTGKRPTRGTESGRSGKRPSWAASSRWFSTYTGRASVTFVGMDHLMTEPDNVNGAAGTQIVLDRRPIKSGIVLIPSGELDIATAPTVEHELLLAEESHKLVALDLSGLSFMDATGLRIMLAASSRLRRRGGRLVVVQGPEQIRRLFELTQMADHLDLVEDTAELERAASQGA